MSKYKERICQLCHTVYKPISPRQKYCINCKDKAVKLKQQQRDKKRVLLKQKEKQQFIRECGFCGKVFSTYYPKKIYCGTKECELARKRKNARLADKKRSDKRKFERKVLKYKNIAVKLKDVKVYIEEHNYSLIAAPKYTDSHHSTLLLKCPNGHLLETTFHGFKDNKVRCMACYLNNSYTSLLESQVQSFLRDNFPDINIICNDRTIIKPKELDIYLPGYNLALELCSLHGYGELSSGKPRSYHYDKMMDCYKQGIRLITIFEDELLTMPEIVFSRIRQAIYRPEQRIFARKCEVKEIDSKTANDFFKANHIQGKSTALIRYGLFYRDNLVAVGSAGNIIRKHTIKEPTLELKRFCSLNNTSVIGGAGRLFKRIKLYAKENNYTLIKSYCDMRYANIFKPVYESLGFKLISFTKYTPHYIKGGKRFRNYSLRKTNEEKLLNCTEWELRSSQGYDRIWDCGHRTYVYQLIN